MKTGEIISNRLLKSGYYEVRFFVPEIAAKAQPGQFVHVRVNHFNDRILRRPFSIHNVEPDGALTVVYKVVGHGTQALSELPAGSVCDLLGPLGRPYTLPAEGVTPVMIAGGYGSAAMYLIARRAADPGILLLGARSEADLILHDRYAALGCRVLLSTNDGSAGEKGFVTVPLERLLQENPGRKYFFYGCGPRPMLFAAAKILEKYHAQGELSLDHVMCCGIGACFACVVKVKDETSPDKWRYARSCSEGPVFPADEIYAED